MYVGRVVGTVVATIKHEAFHGRKLLLVDRLNLEGQAGEEYDICVDVAQAGVGDTVLVIDEGNGARQILKRDTAPIRAVIVGIVDDIEIVPEESGGKGEERKAKGGGRKRKKSKG
jgi:ethanolamine utilization protein EutN